VNKLALSRLKKALKGSTRWTLTWCKLLIQIPDCLLKSWTTAKHIFELKKSVKRAQKKNAKAIQVKRNEIPSRDEEGDYQVKPHLIRFPLKADKARGIAR